MKVAIQGIAGAFHDEAARKFFGRTTGDVHLAECETFSLLCERVDSGEADCGIMAIENTIAGSLLQNYSYLDRFRLKITGEIYLRIKMNLMALPGVGIKDLKYVFSHPIALRQCAEYLDTLRGVIVSEAEDTAESAKKISEQRIADTAAVAGEEAARMYGLEILAAGIETVKQNYTRFIALSKNPEAVADADKASLSFGLRHQPGALAEVLSIFAGRGVNLTKIQSIPILGQPYRYTFYVDVEWAARSDFDASIAEVLRHVVGLSVYGEYKKGELPSES
ncbi:MAG: prephenate dehydratase [Prevotellaceae bacterium]|jgi:prephenate dehydratase|nr:prephenate dehydratase [Prevotellaceae bacterium]